MVRHKNGKGILVNRDGTIYSRKASADQKSPKLKALQACVSNKTEGVNANSREEYRKIFTRASKECQEEVSV